MLRISLLAALLVVQGAIAPAAAACSGADPAIVSASGVGPQANGALNNVRVTITVKNLGSAGQPSNTLQSVEILQQSTKVGLKGIPPLAAGKSYTFVYTFQRSSEAAPGTTRLDLRLVVTQPSDVDCERSNDMFRVSV
jgi:hypothetical protein